MKKKKKCPDEFIDNTGIKFDDAFINMRSKSGESYDVSIDWNNSYIWVNDKKREDDFRRTRIILNSTPVKSNPIYKELKKFLKEMS